MSKIPYIFHTPIPKYFWDKGWLNPKDGDTYFKRLSFLQWAFSRCVPYPRTIFHGHTEIKLEAFEFICGRKAASEETGLSEQTIRTFINQLLSNKTGPTLKKSTNTVTNQFTCYMWSTSHFSETINQQSNQRSTNDQPTINHNIERRTIESSFKKETRKKENSPNSQIVRFRSLLSYEERLEAFSAYVDHHNLCIKDEDFIRWMKKYDDDEYISAHLALLIEEKSAVRDHAKWLQSALSRNYVDEAKRVKENRAFAEEFKLKNKWNSLTITKAYCRDENTQKDFHFKLMTFQKMLGQAHETARSHYA